ncbi:DNA-binding transcriptional LysR family regulator [Ancylobacter sp. 3268]|uniref:LysR family transcriptional regulator n=1 Tax=Ancylobacter sp. 3268 TaxID=2817752 RepID=UPI00285B30E9|nr:LysR family transcriptional regulator [Ancylobacter sp. 3268]MDR6950668.1 DNA-binding transcriptional LysR family regulator [Ancylobacter sp. 3268]
MEMHQIRYFLAVSRTLNFTRAAEDCHVAQPSLTRAIKLLEAELGGDLFRRERNLTHLTEFGKRMLPLLGQCYESAVAAKRLATSIRSGSLVSLTLALSHTVSMTLLIPALTELLRLFPQLELRFLRGTAVEIAEHLKKGDAALAVAGPLGESWERFDAWPLFSEAMEIVVGEASGPASDEPVSLRDLARSRLLYRPYCEMAGLIDEHLLEGQVSWTDRYEVVSEQDLLHLVRSGLGVGVLPKSTASGNTEGLRWLQVDGFEIHRTVSLYGVSGRERSAPAAALLKLLRARDWSADVS